METQTIIFIGPQGSGKGTQVRNLISYVEGHDEKKRHIVDLQTGKPFREMKEKGGYTADLISELVEGGNMVPDVVTTAMLVSELGEQLTSDSHLLIDGYPRNLTQVRELDAILSFFKRTNISVVYLDTPENVVTERMLARGRADDTKESINKRLAWYKEETEPVLEFYKTRENTNFISVDGSKTIQEVQAEVRKGLGL